MAFRNFRILMNEGIISTWIKKLPKFRIDGIKPSTRFHAQMIIDQYYRWHNEKRRHGSLGRQAPEMAWKRYNPIPFENEKLLKTFRKQSSL